MALSHPDNEWSPRERRFAQRQEQPFWSDRPKAERRQQQFKNTLHHLREHRRLVELVRRSYGPRRTGRFEAIAAVPKEEALGALKMLEVMGRCHAISGGRSQLLWAKGPRPADARRPKLVERDRHRFLQLVVLLRRWSSDWISTDGLMREVGFPQRHRKQVRGALKALVALRLVEWRNHTEQAIAWRWVGPEGRGGVFGSKNWIRKRNYSGHIGPAQ